MKRKHNIFLVRFRTRCTDLFIHDDDVKSHGGRTPDPSYMHLAYGECMEKLHEYFLNPKVIDARHNRSVKAS